MHNMFKRIKKILKFTIISLIVLIIVILSSHLLVSGYTKNKVFENVADIPYNRVGLVLGTSPYARNGGPNYFFTYRIDACVALYKAGKIDRILVSGDNHVKTYDEPQYMKDALIKQGIPASAIVLDYAGFRTWDSVIRAKKVFGQSKITIISQGYHNERAVFIARCKGIEAIGFNAKELKRTRTYIYFGFLRESLARCKMFLDLIINKKPKFLGDPIEV